jgi:hypothetical protein
MIILNWIVQALKTPISASQTQRQGNHAMVRLYVALTKCPSSIHEVHDIVLFQS